MGVQEKVNDTFLTDLSEDADSDNQQHAPNSTNAVGNRINFEFHGTAPEYFGIWIVNVLLSFATLGIYSAWAKVRRETYFKNKTSVDGYAFEYHARGSQILKGRLLVVLIVTLLAVLYTIHPIFTVILVPILLYVTVWLVDHSMRFRARMTSYRNVRFNWCGIFWHLFCFYIVTPWVLLLSLGFLTPLIWKHYYCYIATHHSYGTTPFNTNPTTSMFYLAFIFGALLPTVGIALALIIVWVILGSINPSADLTSYFVFALICSGFLIPMIYKVLCRNLVIQNLKLSDAVIFHSSLRPARYIWILFTNLVASLLSLGLLLPWAKVRMYKYLTSCTSITIIGDMNEFVDDATISQSAFGEEFAEYAGIEISI